ncbi:protein SON [Pseudomyrmex gracilis]|uniref:protein SON n=1 Tax=Pseudomyrmex gracilis TaxID=219809 RepID=UPI000994BE83|nr:protein SON [Pseudomyrmex gracilis]
MADLFDIANLITTVGVDGVKVKSEPGLPEKSSNEILTELFSTFNAVDDDVGSSDSRDQQVPNGNAENVKSKMQKKKKKKKHKHKEKKSKKKKSRNNSSDSNSDTEGVRKKKKKEHKKKSKRRHGSVSSRSSESEPKAKATKLENDDLEIAKHNNAEIFDIAEKTSIDDILTGDNISKLNDQQHIKTEPDVTKETADGSDSPCLPPMLKKTDEEVDEPIISRPIEKAKQSAQGKILIKDLKNSVVYSETVKAIEDKQKAKAEGVEEGEISDSSSEDNGEHNLNLTPFRNRSLSFSPSRDRTKSIGSAEDQLRELKTDLRLVLREKDKKRRSTKDKDGKRSTSYHSQDRRRSRSKTRHSLHRSRSNGRERQDGRSRERRDRDRSNERRRHRSHSRSRTKYTEGRSRSRERKERIEIDKKKLLEIARKNAINMIKQGTLPLAQKDKAIAAIQSGGKTVDELTDFCKSLSKSEELGDLSNISSEESESEKGFHHPFLIKERSSSIIMNIRDAKQLPTKTFQEKTAETSNQLRLQFPVSSGQHHRRSENEWIPVTPVKKPEPKKIFVPATSNEPFPMLPALPMPQTEQLPPQLVQPVQPAQITQASQPSQVVFPTTTEVIDIGSIVSERLAAMRRLKEDPNDINALNAMQRAQNEMRMWAESKQMPGQFTGSTGVKVLTPAELSSGCQAWTRKDQLVSAQPVSGGMGMALLQKMGWRPGEGLGKNKEGALEPLQIEVKLDKRGLVSEQDIGPKLGKTTKPVVPTIKTLEGKHPVSLLGEYCSKKKLGPPAYELCFECGPDHRKNFLFKVKVNGIEYKPSVASPNKKQAKAEAAQICLQSLGLLPT